MMNKIIIIAMLITSLSFATNWYVDGALTGTDNGGTSWADAWESFDEINWASIDAGDTLFISGGADSLIYYETLEIYQVQGTAANPITVIAGKYAPNPTGHSGRVIIDGGYYTRLYGVFIQGESTTAQYIIVKGLESRGSTHPITIYDNCNVITIDSCTSYDYLDLAGVYANGQGSGDDQDVDSLIVKNCTIITSYEDPEPEEENQADGIYFGGVTNVLVENNYVFVRIKDPNAHVDGIQSYNCGGTVVIKNNIFMVDSCDDNGGGYAFIVRHNGTSPIIVYNNYMYMGGIYYALSNNSCVFNTHEGDQGQEYGDPSPTYIIHNTFVADGPQNAGVVFGFFGEDSDGIFINNIVAQYGNGVGYWGWLRTVDHSLSAIDVDSVRNNLYYKEWDNVDFGGSWTNGSTTNSNVEWAYWSGTLGGTGINDNPDFVSNIGYDADHGNFRGYLQASSPAINAGEDAEWYIDWLNSTYNLVGDWTLEWTDIEGNARDATPTIGAYEYDSETVDSLPNAFTFTDITDADRSTEYQSNLITLAGFDSAYARAGGAEYVVYPLGVAPEPPLSWVTGYTEVFPTDQIRVRLTSSANYSTATDVPLMVGTRTDIYTVTTEAQPPSTTGGTLRGSDGKIMRDSTGKIIKVR